MSEFDDEADAIEECKFCEGTGQMLIDDDEDIEDCPECGGTGEEWA